MARIGIGRIALGVLAGIAVGNPLLLWAIQERLIFHPVPLNEGQRAALLRNDAVRELELTAADGVKLHGWVQKSAGDARRPLLLYFGGNEEDISLLFAGRDRVAGWSLAAVNYRGYGLSGGKPGERQLFADALAIHDALARRDDVDPRRIAVMGRSLGSGVATYLATQRPVRAVVLVTPYDSIAGIAAEKFWFAPVSWILSHRFDSLARAPAVRAPALFLVAADDEQVPPPRARTLFDAWAGPKQWNLLRGEDHSTIGFHADYWRLVGQFLSSQ